ncbi:MAG: hypothetical protein U0521_07545 [Anaerolineae bacterium]
MKRRPDLDRLDLAGVQPLADIVEAAVGLERGAGHHHRRLGIPQVFLDQRTDMQRRALHGEIFAVLPGADPVDGVGVGSVGEVV